MKKPRAVDTALTDMRQINPQTSYELQHWKEVLTRAIFDDTASKQGQKTHET